MNLKPVYVREALIRTVREYFYGQGFHEVIVPVLNRSVPHEENIVPFSAGSYYLSTSPERGLKRMLARGMGNCFAVSKSFRDLEATGTQHLPEFLMLEWYRKGADYREIMKDTQNIIRRAGYQHGAWITMSLKDLFLQRTGVTLRQALIHEDELARIAARFGYSTQGASWRELWDQLFVNEIESHLPDGPVFLVDFPARLSPLCKPKHDEPYVAQRFELYIDKMEIANGNTENTDEESVRKSFEKEQLKRGSASHPVDEEFLSGIKAMKGGLYAGCGLGIDRLAMLLSFAHDIKEVETLIEA